MVKIRKKRTKMEKDIDEIIFSDDDLTVNDVFRAAKFMMREYNDFKPTLIEQVHLRKYAEESLKMRNQSTTGYSGNWRPWNETIQRFFRDLYGYDMHEARQDYQDNDVNELLRRKQEQAHMAIDFSTDLDTRVN
jgi:hypothetical protein